MKKVEFLLCLSGDVFYKKGDVVELDDKEALHLKNKNIVKIIEEQVEEEQVEEEQVEEEQVEEEQVEEELQNKKGKGKK
ncbi:hypothetical protein [Campylobacter insulaenigrae]|uniref:hypothetical protein n=1 Tax=Campylobacter insulaenigrae TaxID=260714 RepID=UPI002153370B|nr:hypothetical protein [Campylobacter insulaenigrae]MCR6572975.1 hypothetical protein [Campylobacter insulaenigrae]